MGLGHVGITSGLLQVIRAAFVTEPMLVVAIVAGAAMGAKRRDLGSLAIYVVIGSTLAFMLVSYGTGAITPELRYLVTVVPLCILSLAVALRPAREALQTVKNGLAKDVRSDRGVAAQKVAVILLVLLSIAGLYSAVPSTFAALRGGSEYRQQANSWAAERAIAADFDALGLPRGAILIDSFLGFPIIQASARPDQFVATSDRDFKQALSDPTGLGVRYLMVPEPKSTGKLDALNRTYPGIYEPGGGVGELVEEFSTPLRLWRLFRVVSN